ncbi:MAG: hypothetical protein IPI85_09450 [Dehalococcoidia bacterium]|uniref:hypothetical protein n=1 Tax=Candidatus Amarobacter glycogenicus TaxID=3140699 RepID=UPI002A1349BE|nr:hypothetical protein [Dehalococcoidia bacterium]MBK6562943.1 hypothetical protein [Dehalococcoidia bacterium]MBK7126588.1 hypothetical protein [Dehalococcoidia bacterium]MBK7329286.1 hypothetical protein [Dehalococcoidia bacterium]MBK8561711.1 hypothetical protein [Dehalococcoidia bacterium]
MDNFWHIFFIWVHILGVALLVGPQFFMAYAWIPASRNIDDLRVRVKAMRTITRRFGYVGGAGIVLLVCAGTYLIIDWRDYYAVDESVSFTALRFGVVFIIKMTLFTVMVAALAAHMFWLGPRQLERLEAQANGERISPDEVRRARIASMITSVLALALALAIMVMGVMLNSVGWSLQEV